MMLSHSFFDDAKIRALTLTERWLFLRLLEHCSNIAGDLVETSPKVLREWLECQRNIDGVLDRLQSLRLVTWEKKTLFETSFIKRSKVKRIETNKLVSSSELESSNAAQTSDAESLEKEKKVLAAEPEKIIKVSSPGELDKISRIQDLVLLIPESTRKSWRELYSGDEEFVKRQLIRCWQYYAIDKPHRRPRKINGWSRAINTWLEREWVKHSLKIKPGQNRV